MPLQIGTAPAYLIRNPYTYCFRICVPADLRKYLCRKELRYSLKTGYLSQAKFKARLLAGFVQLLFRWLRERTTMKLADQQIQDIAIEHPKRLKECFDAPKPLFKGIPVEGSTDQFASGTLESDSFLAALVLEKQIETFAIDKLQMMADLETGAYQPTLRELPELLMEHDIAFSDVDQDDPSFIKNP